MKMPRGAIASLTASFRSSADTRLSSKARGMQAARDGHQPGLRITAVMQVLVLRGSRVAVANTADVLTNEDLDKSWGGGKGGCTKTFAEFFLATYNCRKTLPHFTAGGIAMIFSHSRSCSSWPQAKHQKRANKKHSAQGS